MQTKIPFHVKIREAGGQVSGFSCHASGFRYKVIYTCLPFIVPNVTHTLTMFTTKYFFLIHDIIISTFFCNKTWS